jgi:hypothetical protein
LGGWKENFEVMDDYIFISLGLVMLEKVRGN